VFSGTEIGSRYFVIAPNSIGDYNSETAENQSKYGWIADGSDQVGVGNDDPYIIS